VGIGRLLERRGQLRDRGGALPTAGASAGQVRTLGRAHEDTQGTIASLAALLRAQSRAREVDELLLQAQ
jgi:hypothetical protein